MSKVVKEIQEFFKHIENEIPTSKRASYLTSLSDRARITVRRVAMRYNTSISHVYDLYVLKAIEEFYHEHF